jgi:hypothetical protein
MSLPAHIPLTLQQGATLAKFFVWNNPDGGPFNPSGFTAQLVARQRLLPEQNPPCCDCPTPYVITLTTTPGAQGSIVLSLGQIALNATGAQTQYFAPGTYDYQLTVFDSSGNPYRRAYGPLLVVANLGDTVPSPCPPPYPPTYVRVNANGSSGAAKSPYTALPNQTVIVDTSQGSVVVNMSLLTFGQTIAVAQDAGTAWAGGTTITVNGPAGVLIAQPVPNLGEFEDDFVFPLQPGIGLTWYNGGSPGGYLIQ